MRRPIIILIDMDDCIADFQRADAFKDLSGVEEHLMFEPGFFRDLKPVPGALTSVRKLIRLGFDVQILTQPVAESPHCYQEKIQWLGMWFPELVSKVNMVQDKGLLGGPGRFLIDDNAKKWREAFKANGGTFIHLEYDSKSEEKCEQAWLTVLEIFKREIDDGRF